MTIETYSGSYRVRTKIIVGERMIPGRIGRGSQIYAGAGQGRFGLLVLNAIAANRRNVRPGSSRSRDDVHPERRC